MTDKAKLEEIKKLADAMYYAALNLTTDASLLRKAMNEYHQFVIHKYCKEEPVSEQNLSNVERTVKNWKEESVSEDLLKELKGIVNIRECVAQGVPVIKIARHFANWQKQQDSIPSSVDLEEAINAYIGYAPEVDECSSVYGKRQAFKAGAEWQKEHFEKNRLKHCDSITNEQAELEQGFIDQHLDKYQRMPTFLDAVEYGMRLQKEQMMAKAGNGRVDSVSNRQTRAHITVAFDSPRDIEVLNRLKVIVIKED